MQLKFLCEKCGTELYPKYILPKSPRDQGNYFTVPVCDCSYKIEIDIIATVQKAIQDMKAKG